MPRPHRAPVVAPHVQPAQLRSASRPPLQVDEARIQPPTDDWIAPDKAGHFIGSYLAHTTVYATMRTAGADAAKAQTGAVVTALTLGLAKELFDRYRGGPFSWKDIVWDIAGTAVAAGALALTDG